MAGGTWQPLGDDGIMMWEPAVVVKVEDTEEKHLRVAFDEGDIQDQLNTAFVDDEGMAVLPSVELPSVELPSVELPSVELPSVELPSVELPSVELPFSDTIAASHDAYFKKEKVEFTPSRLPSRTKTLSLPSSGRVFSTDTLTSMSEPSPLQRSWADQLKAFAELSRNRNASTDENLIFTTSSKSDGDRDARFTSENSDRTDFQLDSPCPVEKIAPQPLQAINNLQTVARLKPKPKKDVDAVVRRLDFGTTLKKSGLARTDAMWAPEYSARHDWTSSERIFLCSMYRWYKRDYSAFTTIFNEAFKLDISKAKLNTQFANYERVDGGSVSIEYNDVFFITPFTDPDGRHAACRHYIAHTARALGIKIHRLEVETQSPSGKAARLRNSLMRKYKKEITRKATMTAAAPLQLETFIQHPVSIGGFSLPTGDQEDVFTDVEEEVSCMEATESLPHAIQHTPPSLVFRVWDASSRTKFGPDGFVSSAFIDWTEIPPPIPPNDPHQAFKLLAYLHLSKVGDTPCFIAASESLVQVLTIAASLNRPKIAMIDLSAPCMLQEHKTHLAFEILRWLKTDGKIKLRYRYQGYGDWFTHATIPNEAIFKHFELSELINLCEHDDEAASLLNLEAFHPGCRTGEVVTANRERRAILNTSVAGAIGRIANLFLGQTAASLPHISAFVACLVDGWSVEKNAATDMHSMSSIAAAFARNFGSLPGCNYQQIMGAFLDGVEVGVKSIARWSRSGTGRRKKKR